MKLKINYWKVKVVEEICTGFSVLENEYTGLHDMKIYSALTNNVNVLGNISSNLLLSQEILFS